MKKIAYLGPENSYSYLAAKKIAEPCDVLIASPSFPDVFDSVRTGAADIAVAPVENSIEGSVSEVTDCLISDGETPPLFIVSELRLKIDNYLIARSGADFGRIERLVTHRQPYAQCRRTLRGLLPDAEVVFSDSTSAAVKEIRDDKTAAVGGMQLLNEGLKLSEHPVNDSEHNSTRFIVLSASEYLSPENDKLTVLFEAENKPGGLLKLLEIIHAFGMNMTRIESRPHKSALGRYVFIADITGNVLDADTSSALELLKRNTVFFRYLGCYRSSER